MPFREKTAWIYLTCLLATFGVFFFLIGHGLMPSHGMRAMRYFLSAIAGFIILQVVLLVAARIAAPRDAKTPLDERERLIRLKAARNAYVTLGVGAMFVPFSLHLGVKPIDMAWVSMVALFVSEVVRSVSQIIYFRLGR